MIAVGVHCAGDTSRSRATRGIAVIVKAGYEVCPASTAIRHQQRRRIVAIHRGTTWVKALELTQAAILPHLASTSYHFPKTLVYGARITRDELTLAPITRVRNGSSSGKYFWARRLSRWDLVPTEYSYVRPQKQSRHPFHSRFRGPDSMSYLRGIAPTAPCARRLGSRRIVEPTKGLEFLRRCWTTVSNAAG